jgi:uncharacterized protein
MASPGPDWISVEVAYAQPHHQWLLSFEIRSGTTARAALLASPLAAACPELDLQVCPLGVWGRLVADDAVLRAGDRLEVYRPLAADPRAARRAVAAKGGTLGVSAGKAGR